MDVGSKLVQIFKINQMKNIFLIMICSLISYNIWGQCRPIQVSTNPEYPFNEEVGTSSQAHLNNFDWLQIPDYYPVIM